MFEWNSNVQVFINRKYQRYTVNVVAFSLRKKKMSKEKFLAYFKKKSKS